MAFSKKRQILVTVIAGMLLLQAALVCFGNSFGSTKNRFKAKNQTLIDAQILRHRRALYEKGDGNFDITERVPLLNKKLGNHLRYKYYPLKFPKRHLYVCTIPKNCQTELIGFFCEYYYGYNKTLQNWAGFIGLYKQCWAKLVKTETYKHIQNAQVTNHWRKIVLIRDPMERLISAYMNICVKFNKLGKENCYFCEDFSCFVQRNYRMLTAAAANAVEPEHQHEHFYPQYWFCGFSLGDKGYKIIKVSSDANAFGKHMRHLFYEYGFKNIHKSKMFFHALPHHATKKMPELQDVNEQLERNPNLLHLVFLSYKADYEAFRYRLPSVAKRYCSEPNNHWSFCPYYHEFRQ